MREKKTLGIICVIAVLAVLGATLWPFNPFPRNGVRWLPDANGIQFDQAGLVIGKPPSKAPDTTDRQPCSLELLLKPAAVDSASTILSFYTPNNPRQFVVRQWTDGLLVWHEAADSRGKLKRIKFDLDHAFQPGKLVLLTFVSGPHGMVVYKDGRQAQSFPRFTISQVDLTGQIVMGTSPVDYEPWAGEVRGLAIYSGELTPAEVFAHYQDWTDGSEFNPSRLSGATALYSFTERTGHEIHNAVASGPDLEIPEDFAVPHKARLASPEKEFERSWRYAQDLLQNILGFVPLGFVVCAYLAATRSRGKAILGTILTLGTLSFAIEVLQAFVPRRSSGMTDIITNTLGAAIGAVLARQSTVRRFLGLLRQGPRGKST
jgi:VanZ family protein